MYVECSTVSNNKIIKNLIFSEHVSIIRLVSILCFVDRASLDNLL